MRDPRDVWLSENFRLSDFLGNHSVYARGYSNRFVSDDIDNDPRVANAAALCGYALEPLLATAGPLSISYGFISHEFSVRTVKYQDPNLPSHHRWDLGAAADVLAHRWVQDLMPQEVKELIPDEGIRTAPTMLAHTLDAADIPYSRLISYSESPYLCIAVSHAETEQGRPRRAFYENRYQGKPKAKPEYIQMSSPVARARMRTALQEQGLPAPWQGSGYPTYHGGGINQYQHQRVSKYTTVLDWLFNMKSISEGHKNIPALHDEKVQDGFAAAGLIYDHLLDQLHIPRLSILSGYVCRSHPDYDKGNDWRGDRISFEVGTPQNTRHLEFYDTVFFSTPMDVSVEVTERGVMVSVPVESTLNGSNGVESL